MLERKTDEVVVVECEAVVDMEEMTAPETTALHAITLGRREGYC